MIVNSAAANTSPANAVLFRLPFRNTNTSAGTPKYNMSEAKRPSEMASAPPSSAIDELGGGGVSRAGGGESSGVGFSSVPSGNGGSKKQPTMNPALASYARRLAITTNPRTIGYASR